MNNIQGLLNIFENLIKTEEGFKSIISEVIEREVGVKIDPQKIKASEFVLYLDTHPVIRNEIFLQKEKILSSLSKKTGKDFDNLI
jgi:hypothetical protein